MKLRRSHNLVSYRQGPTKQLEEKKDILSDQKERPSYVRY
jgi:hypothetical protein